ncbi:MAG: hypothetical protein WAQ10_05365 [Dethiobacteria bacterium]
MLRKLLRRLKRRLHRHVLDMPFDLTENWRELAAFILLLGMGLILIILIWFGVEIPFLMRN